LNANNQSLMGYANQGYRYEPNISLSWEWLPATKNGYSNAAITAGRRSHRDDTNPKPIDIEPNLTNLSIAKSFSLISPLALTLAYTMLKSISFPLNSTSSRLSVLQV
jgi:hypothetical protein